MPWAVAAAGVMAAGTVASGAMSSSAASKASDKANATQAAALAQSRADQQPYIQQGSNALMAAGNLSGANGPEAGKAALNDFTASPGYQYSFDQSMRAVNAGAAANGMANSGSTLKALQDRGQSLAAQDFGSYYNRLAGLAGLGQNAAAGVGNQGVATAAGQAQTDVSAASTQASIYGNTAQGIGNAAGAGMNNYRYLNGVDNRNSLLSGDAAAIASKSAF